MNLIDAFKEGKLEGINKEVPNHIVTAISNIFVFENIVYKIYRTDSEFFNQNFNDLSKKENRFAFTRNDFDWNNRLSPEIYIELKGSSIKDDSIVFSESTDDADELVIVMNKIDMRDQIIKKLVANKITLQDCYEIGRQFGERILKQPKATIDITPYEDFKTRTTDEEAWIMSVKETANEAPKYVSFVKGFIEEHREELGNKEDMSFCLDVHADNAVYTSGKFLPIDTYAPKEAWLYGYKNINIYRVATDFYVFMGKAGFDEVIKGFEDVTECKLPRDWDKFMILYCEIIMWPYQYMLAEKEPWRLEVAEKHRQFVEKIFNE